MFYVLSDAVLWFFMDFIRPWSIFDMSSASVFNFTLASFPIADMRVAI